MLRSIFLIGGVICLSLATLFWLRLFFLSSPNENPSPKFSVTRESQFLVVQADGSLLVKNGSLKQLGGSWMQPTESGQFYWKFETDINAGKFRAVRCGPGICQLVWHEFDLDAPTVRNHRMAFVIFFGWAAAFLFFCAWAETRPPLAARELSIPVYDGRHPPAGPKTR